MKIAQWGPRFSMRTDRQTDRTLLIFDFRNIANASKNQRPLSHTLWYINKYDFSALISWRVTFKRIVRSLVEYMTYYIIWCCMIWYDILWYIWYDILWYICYDMIYYDIYDMILYNTIRYVICYDMYGMIYMIWYCMIWYDTIWYVTICMIYDVIWYICIIWYDSICYVMICMIWYMMWYDMIYDLYDDIWYMLRYDTIRYNTVRYGMVWYDIWCDMIYLSITFWLTSGGSSTVHIYTQTIHRTTQQQNNTNNN
jgi:hypothetical protein